MTVGFFVQLVVGLWRKCTVMVEICALYMALFVLIGPAEIFSWTRGVVQALIVGELNVMAPGPKTLIFGVMSERKNQ